MGNPLPPNDVPARQHFVTADSPAHPASGLDDIVHQKARLGILVIVHEAGRAEFSYLAQALQLTNGNLSRHLRVLEDANLLAIEKGYADRRPRTWIALTTKGKRALKAELDVLRAIIARMPLA